MGIKMIWKCIFTPRLIKVFGNGPVERKYEPSALESLGDSVIQSMYLLWKIGVYTTPLIVGYLYRRGYFENEGYVTLTKFATLIGGILIVSYVIRGIGRSNNLMYKNFIHALNEAEKGWTPGRKQQLAIYDFEFYAWPVEFRYSDISRDEVKDRIYISKPNVTKTIFEKITWPLCHMIGYFAIHTFGIRLIYPGSLGLLQKALADGLLQGRSKLIEVNGATRYKLQAKDGNEIDAMFVDKRDKDKVHGSTLVICCEGNAGFYEIGIMGTPIAAGYSVLGWNHPGFGGSTGTPFPDQELNAMDIVMQFAVVKLGFRIENIIIFGWSIGGFAASWAAMNYPDIKGLILDASFDDILPLAKNHMPSWSKSIVRMAIREYVNLNNVEQIIKYPGPVLLIRRTEDEVICLDMGYPETNRGNFLLMKLLRYRFPELMGSEQLNLLTAYLAKSSKIAQDEILTEHKMNPDKCQKYLNHYFNEHSRRYPSHFGEGLGDKEKNQIVLYMATKMMKDYKSSHCTPLPSDMFQVPWDVPGENGFVFT